MGVFYFNFGGYHFKSKNVLSYRVHDWIFDKILKNDSEGLSFQIGFGSTYQELGESPNAPEGFWLFNRRVAIADIYNEGGLIDPNADDYSRQTVTWTLTRHKLSTHFETGWHFHESRITWESHGDWKPDDWNIENPLDDFYTSGSNPWKNGCLPYQKILDFPYCTPVVFDGWWADYTNCLDPSNYGGACPSHSPQNGEASCSVCPDLGLMGLSSPPTNIAFITITRDEETRLFAATKFSAPFWYRRSGKVAIKYMARVY